MFWALTIPAAAIVSLTIHVRAELQATINNVHASRILLGEGHQAQGSWLDSAQLPAVHAAGLRGEGQVIGLGDTGLDASACAFSDPTAPVPYDLLDSQHRKIVSYFATHGDRQDGLHGHGTHIAGSIAGEAPSLGAEGLGIAPGAKLAVVDLEESSRPGTYNVPDSQIDSAYFDFLRHSGAAVVCSPWSFTEHPSLSTEVDRYAWENQDFLPIFPSGNLDTADSTQLPHAPCRAKNVLCVGASFNSREAYLTEPSFVNAVLQLGNSSCRGAERDSCAEEVQAYPALFGPTSPLHPGDCEIVRDLCLRTRAACPECAFSSSTLGRVADAFVTAATPRDGCRPLVAFQPGTVCLVERGSCDFSLKAHHCAQAQAVGAIVLNHAGASDTVMVEGNEASAPLDLSIPTVLVRRSEESRLLSAGRRVTFPTISRAISPDRRAPYSSFGRFADGLAKPDIVLPGDNIASAAANEECALIRMSGTSQSCGFAAGTAALLREYLQAHGDKLTSRLPNPWASTLRALLVAAASPALEDGAVNVRRDDVGFGLPALAALLPPPLGSSAGLLVVQSHAQREQTQTFCVSTGRADGGEPRVVLAWTDPPGEGIVHDLDLHAQCSADSWTLQAVNGLLPGRPDRSSTTEKALLLPSSLCIVSVTVATDANSAAWQPFALVLVGSLGLVPGCEVQTAPGPQCGPAGTAQKLEGHWACTCEAGWTGPLCQQQLDEVTLSAAEDARLGAGRVLAGHLRPWQWAFYRGVACGQGRYELRLDGNEGVTHLQASASTTLGNQLWSSQALANATDGSSWAEPGVVFSTTRTSEKSFVVSVEVAAAGSQELFFSVFSRGRDGPLDFHVRWQETHPGCAPVLSTSPARESTEDSGDNFTVGRAILYGSLGLLAVLVPIALCMLGRLCVDRRRRRPGGAVFPVSPSSTGQGSKAQQPGTEVWKGQVQP